MTIDDELGYGAGIWPEPSRPNRRPSPGGDPGAETFDLIGPPLEEELHEIDVVNEALLDEGGSLDDADDEPAIEWAVCQDSWGLSRRPPAIGTSTSP